MQLCNIIENVHAHEKRYTCTL